MGYTEPSLKVMTGFGDWVDFNERTDTEQLVEALGFFRLTHVLEVNNGTLEV